MLEPKRNTIFGAQSNTTPDDSATIEVVQGMLNSIVSANVLFGFSISWLRSFLADCREVAGKVKLV